MSLYQAPLTKLSKFKFIDNLQSPTALATSKATETNTLLAINQTLEGQDKIVRYQQLYKGIPVIGAQVMVIKNSKPSLTAKANSQVNGQILEEIQMEVKPTISSKDALNLAKDAYFKLNPKAATTADLSQLQIRIDQEKDSQPGLFYLVSFKTTNKKGKPAWPNFIINAQNSMIIEQWSNLKYYLDTGPGGNEKVHEYWYGQDELPSLDVQQEGTNCVMESSKVRLVHLESKWDWDSEQKTAFQYNCGKNLEENINGAFSPANDAYFFGHTIVDMYKNWYGLNALQYISGKPMKLIMRVHFGEDFDNAFWDGVTMSFGDGKELYPLVSLDIAGHEVTHGFTQQHSDLEYHNQSGALNESLSDMAGQAARAYLLETSPALYNKAHLTPNKITWGIGETVMRGQFGTAIRYMDQPSADENSADCLDKLLAKRNKATCTITYSQLVNNAYQIDDPQERQNYIVHTASGIFNKAFYLLSQKLGIKQTYQAMALANVKYWTPTTGFKSGACGVLRAAKDLNIDLALVKTAFGQVGIDTQSCFN